MIFDVCFNENAHDKILSFSSTVLFSVFKMKELRGESLREKLSLHA